MYVHNAIVKLHHAGRQLIGHAMDLAEYTIL